jgi:hypothetical protein
MMRTSRVKQSIGLTGEVEARKDNVASILGEVDMKEEGAE